MWAYGEMNCVNIWAASPNTPPILVLAEDKLPQDPAAKADQDTARGAFDFPDQIPQPPLNLRQRE